MLVWELWTLESRGKGANTIEDFIDISLTFIDIMYSPLCIQHFPVCSHFGRDIQHDSNYPRCNFCNPFLPVLPCVLDPKHNKIQGLNLFWYVMFWGQVPWASFLRRRLIGSGKNCCKPSPISPWHHFHRESCMNGEMNLGLFMDRQIPDWEDPAFKRSYMKQNERNSL